MSFSPFGSTNVVMLGIPLYTALLKGFIQSGTGLSPLYVGPFYSHVQNRETYLPVRILNNKTTGARVTVVVGCQL